MGDSNTDPASARGAVDDVRTPPPTTTTHAMCAEAADRGTAMLTRSRVIALVAPVGGALGLSATGEVSRPAVAAIMVLAVLLLAWLTSSIFSELHRREVLEKKVADQTADLHQSVYRDTVTGLGNRALLRERAITDRVLVGTTAVLLLDLDGFKEINNTLGHICGDAALVQVGLRLGGLTRTQDTVVRLGGDEFVLLLPETGQAAAMSIAQRALVSLREPVTVGGTKVRVRASLGMALGSSSVDVDELVRQADLAMYAAKAEGGDLARVFQPAMHDRLRDRLQIESEIREALEKNQFAVYYQPIIDTRSAKVTGLEALVRWDHPLRGVLPPYEFLPAAERTGLIRELGMFVLHTACEQVSEWRRDWPELTVAVNLSHSELLDPELGAKVADVLADTALPPHALHLEITETVVSTDDQIQHAIASLAAQRISFSIDDFGTGHSSLSRLRSLPVQRLKIDRSFIGEIVEGRAPLLSSIIALAHSLGRTVVAEGVETPEQFDFLVGQGCDEVQGYLFSRPVPANHVVPLLFSTRVPREDIERGSPSVLPELISTLSDDRLPLDPATRALLRELSSLSGLETTFVTTVRDGQQVTRYAHNAGAMTIPEGLSVNWSDTLCRRLIEADMQHSAGVGMRFGDLDAVGDLGIETYVTIPIKEPGGKLIGTLCGASAQPKEVDDSVLSLMRLFAVVLAERIPALGRAVDAAPSTIPSPAAR